MLSPIMSFAADGDKPEAPRNKILPYRSNYTCSGEWQTVVSKKNSRNVSQKFVGYRCIDKRTR
ncbi:MAG: hypothetical protein QNL04_14965 [SAR324 cluster bacterium]|nr:hypothetical protein [SAR324 cluster bacterium]